MEKLVVSALILALSMWALQYTGPLTPENGHFLISAFLWFIAAVSALRVTVALLTLPFKRKQ